MNDLIMFALSMITVAISFGVVALICFSVYKIISKYSKEK